MMIKLTHLLLAGAVAFALCDASRAQDTPARPPGVESVDLSSVADAVAAQNATPRISALPGSPEAAVGGGVLEALPQPRDTPRSLFGPEQPASNGGIRIDAPYFTPDPLLDISPFAPPGWFAGAEAQIVKPHLINDYKNSVFPGKVVNDTTGIYPLGPNAKTVDLPAGPLDWTASPRIFAGYRLPSGFGEFMIAYRHLATSGGSTTPGSDGLVNLYSRFAFETLDIDYNSRELSLWPNWDMKWTLGLRMLFLFSSTEGTQPFGQASTGNGVFAARQSTSTFGIGPHSALELNRRLGDSGWSLLFRTDFGAAFSYVNQDWSAASTSLNTNGLPMRGQTNAFGHQFIPMINGRAGLSWRPSPTSGTRVFVGYQYEVFWDLNRLPQNNGTPYAPPSLGQYWSQGIVLQAAFNW